MEHPAFTKMMEMALQPDALEATIAYLAGNLAFLKKNEKVLICFDKKRPGAVGELMEKAVLRCGAVPILIENDWRWKTMLRLAFNSRASTIIAPPLIVLGLWKIAKYNSTPLNIRSVVTAGYPCPDWMIDGIIQGLDCRTYGCFGPGGGSVVAGFSCGKSRGAHLRSDVYGISIVDLQGRELPDGEVGEMVLYPLAAPEVRFPVGERARLERTPCPCGCGAPRLLDLQTGSISNQDLMPLGDHLQSWTSVLDCRVRKGGYGLELEIITFPGEKLPKLPTAAKLVIRPWDPDKDEPFFYAPGIENM